MKKANKKYYIAEFYKTPEEIQKQKEQIDKEMKSVLQTIKQGKIYAKVNSVSRSGMSRKISFYRVEKGEIKDVTTQVAWLSGHATPGKLSERGKYFIDEGLRVSGCGMDMIFNTLYNCMPYSQSKKWSQRYKTL